MGDDWNNLTTSYDLRMWYLQNTPHQDKTVEYAQDLEKIHHELNYLHTRILLRNLMIFTGLFYTFYTFYEVSSHYDWQDAHDPKFSQRLYMELEEGGDEGEEDDD